MDALCYSGVYAIVNLFNGKVYIGSAVILTRRLDDHFRALKGKPKSEEHKAKISATKRAKRGLQ